MLIVSGLERVPGDGSAAGKLAISCGLPVVAKMGGRCEGAGFLAASLCDFLICDENGTYGRFHEGRLPFFVERFGAEFARSLLAGVSGRELPPGVPSLPESGVDSHTMKLARRLGEMPRESLILLKRHLARRFESFLDGLSGPDSVREGPPDAGFDPGQPVRIDIGSDVVRLETWRCGVAVVTLCDRVQKNAFTDSLVEGVSRAFGHVRTDPDCKAVVLTGYDTYFASGGSKDALLAIHEGKAKYSDAPLYELPLHCEVPVVAAMQGHAIGAGWSFAMFCDFAIFSEESLYSTRFMDFGFTPGFGSTLVFPERLGEDLGREALFTANEYKGSDLRARGVPSVFPRSEVLARAMNLATAMSRLSGGELRRLKEKNSRHIRESLADIVERELAMHEKTFIGNEHALREIRNKFRETDESADREGEAIPRPAGEAHADLKEWLRNSLAGQISMKPEDIDDDAQFAEMGVDSVVGVAWVREVNHHYGISLAATKVYNHPTLREFSNLVFHEGKRRGIFGERPAIRTKVPRDIPTKPRAIAVVGMAGRFPKSRNLNEYWDNLLHGRDCVSEVPGDRWDMDRHYDPDAKVPGKSYSKWMGVLEDADRFDPLFFNIAPRDAERMDPQQRLFLQTAWHCIPLPGRRRNSLGHRHRGRRVRPDRFVRKPLRGFRRMRVGGLWPPFAKRRA